MTARPISIAIQISSRGISKSCRFDGIGYLEAGFMSGSILNHDRSFTQAEHTLISAFTLTGCPIVARSEAPNLNPWLETAGAYRSQRLLEAEKFEVHSQLESKCDGLNIGMNLMLDIRGDIEGLRSINNPFQECIKQIEAKRFSGDFALDFLDSSNRLQKAKAISRYFLNTSKSYSSMWRNITIVDSHESDAFRQIEQIDLFGSSEEAAADLASKIAASVAVQAGGGPENG
jgi:hypothetical protein